MFKDPEIINLTPQLARTWLENSNNFRTISPGRVNKLAEDILKYGYKFDGNPFRFNDLNQLVDGQHRASAIIKINTTVKVLVVYGVDESTIDTGQTRQSSQFLIYKGEKYATELSGALGCLFRYKRDPKSIVNSNQSNKLSFSDMESLLESDPEIRNSVVFCKRVCDIGGSVRLNSAIHYLVSRKNLYKANEFINGIITGANLSENDPRLKLRNRLLTEKNTKRTSSQNEIAALTIKAWNTFFSNRNLTILKFGDKENFPELLGV